MRALLILFLAAAVAACSHGVQTSSGVEYLERYERDALLAKQDGAPTDMDETVRKAASVEPIFSFPAKFGVACIERGQLTGIPDGEVALWTGLVEKKASLGKFVPISPLIAKFTATAVLPDRERYYGRSRTGDLVAMIRLGAARQHVDAVLIYEVGASGRNEDTALAFADVTIIGGAFLPTRQFDAHGVAQAMLLDVRNGYPYGTASAVADLTSYSTSWEAARRSDDLQADAELEVVENLVPEVEAMFDDLVVEMAKKRVAQK